MNTADVGNNGSIDVTYKFDALGRRVFRDDGTTATVYVQAGQQTIADYTAGAAAASPTYRYVYASYIDEPVLRFKPSGSESLYYHRNQQYSVVALTNASATIVERYAYTAYGVPTITNASGTVLPLGTVNNRYMYTGREWDSVLAQYHYRARMYDAPLGRFTSRDPIEFEGSKWSMYSAMSSRPLAASDPFGLLTKMLIPPIHPAVGACMVVVAGTHAPPFGYCMYHYHKAKNAGRFKNDPMRYKVHCFLNCCMAKVTLGLPIFYGAFCAKEIPEITEGDFTGECLANTWGYWEGIDDLYITDPYNYSGHCIDRCDREQTPAVPEEPAQPYIPVLPGDADLYKEQLCHQICRDETMEQFPGLSNEADDYYSTCLRSCLRSK